MGNANTHHLAPGKNVKEKKNRAKSCHAHFLQLGMIICNYLPNILYIQSEAVTVQQLKARVMQLAPWALGLLHHFLALWLILDSSPKLCKPQFPQQFPNPMFSLRSYYQVLPQLMICIKYTHSYFFHFYNCTLKLAMPIWYWHPINNPYILFKILIPSQAKHLTLPSGKGQGGKVSINTLL